MGAFVLPAAAVSSLVFGNAFAACELPSSIQSQLVPSAQETVQFMAENSSVGIIDTPIPEEIDETGMVDGIDALIPLALRNDRKTLEANLGFLLIFTPQSIR